jgi:hypothetical protein
VESNPNGALGSSITKTNIKKMETLNYDFFLFCELARYKRKDLLEEPYDVQFDTFVELYNEFVNGRYNDVNKSTYDCICLFLNHKKKESFISEVQSILNDDILSIVEIEKIIHQYKNNQ